MSGNTPTAEPILQVENLKMHFPVLGGVFRHQVAVVKAVDGVSFTLNRGETLGLVGESGCGKSTCGRTIIQLYKPTAGKIFLTRGADRVDLATLTRRELKPWRAHIQMIFQDPYSSLNPRMTVGDIIDEPMTIHARDKSMKEIRQKTLSIMGRCGLRPEQATRYPHEFSGGQRQRVGIARALATNPAVIIADEPVSALDVSVQAQVINLMQDLQDELGLTYLFIAHDLSVVKHISNRIAVMYLGNIVEIGPTDEIYFRPFHPYSRALLSAVPEILKDKKNRQILQGDVPTPLAKPSGCGFRTRCPIARPECAEGQPPMVGKGPGHFVACPYV